VKVPIGVCRVAYRCAYQGLRVYWFVRRPDVQGVKCVLTNGECVLLVRHTYGHREWDLPGGSVRRREPPDDTARREMQEELGVAVDRFTHLGDIRARIDHRRDTMHLYHAELGDHPITLDRCELAEFAWFERRTLPSELGRFVNRILAVLPS
jgi:8-oxo-dGTP pyrophosphatase MutT (NUDIX family)